MLYSILIKKEL